MGQSRCNGNVSYPKNCSWGCGGAMSSLKRRELLGKQSCNGAATSCLGIFGRAGVDRLLHWVTLRPIWQPIEALEAQWAAFNAGQPITMTHR